jgi:hypothetical protein
MVLRRGMSHDKGSRCTPVVRGDRRPGAHWTRFRVMTSRKAMFSTKIYHLQHIRNKFVNKSNSPNSYTVGICLIIGLMRDAFFRCQQAQGALKRGPTYAWMAASCMSRGTRMANAIKLNDSKRQKSVLIVTMFTYLVPVCLHELCVGKIASRQQVAVPWWPQTRSENWHHSTGPWWVLHMKALHSDILANGACSNAPPQRQLSSQLQSAPHCSRKLNPTAAPTCGCGCPQGKLKLCAKA